MTRNWRSLSTIRRFFSLYVCVVITFLAGASIVRAESGIVSPELDSALSFLGMTRSDFYSDRCWVDDDTFLLPRVREALGNPLTAHSVCHEFSSAAPSEVSEAGRVVDLFAFTNANCPEFVRRDIDAQLAAARPPMADPFEPMFSAFALAEGYRRQAFAAFTPPQEHALLLAAPLWFEDESHNRDDSLKGMLHRAFGLTADTSQSVTADCVLTLLTLVNRDALAAAAYAFARGLALTAHIWQNNPPPFQTAVAPGVDGLVIAARQTPFGMFVMGGPGPNTYHGDFALILDLGGDDRYLSRTGSAVAGLGQPLSAVLDFSGDDVYAAGLIADQGCGVMGLGAVVDLKGNDIYRAGAFSQGVAFCGVGLFFDENGNDTYRAGLFSQAAAVCGVSVFCDGGGRDVYDVTSYGQAFASTFGASALVDWDGNDVYRAGGNTLHEPLRPEDYQSFAQGFAIGVRPRAAGGIALLHDRSGNDFYNAEIYAQGVAYWYSLAALFDDAGNDVYNGTQYVQGAGIHLAVGVLEDGSGDDRYTSRFGPGQGSAHDLSVGLLYDRSGDDQYMLSGGQGSAITNSAALFFDESGNDSYYTTERELGQGGVRSARNFGNVGVFVDAEGQDVYSFSNRADSTLWISGLYGIGYDVPRDVTRPREAPVEVSLIPQDTLRTVEELFRDASLWEVTDNRVVVRRARLALAAKGIDAVHWVGENKLNTDDGLERRAIAELFKSYPDSAAPYLIRAFASESRDARRTAIFVFEQLKYRPAVPALLQALQESGYEKQRPAILASLGEIDEMSAVADLLPFASSPVERERIAAISSLGKLRDRRGYPAMIAALGDPLYTVRSASILAISLQSADVLLPLSEAMLKAPDREVQDGLRAVAALAAQWKSDEKQRGQISRLSPLVRRYLEHPVPRIRASALAAAEHVMSEKEVRRFAQAWIAADDPVLKADANRIVKKTR